MDGQAPHGRRGLLEHHGGNEELPTSARSPRARALAPVGLPGAGAPDRGETRSPRGPGTGSRPVQTLVTAVRSEADGLFPRHRGHGPESPRGRRQSHRTRAVGCAESYRHSGRYRLSPSDCSLPRADAEGRIGAYPRPGSHELVVPACARIQAVRTHEGRTVTTGLTSVPARPSSATRRSLEPADWSSGGAPLLRDPRHLVKDLHTRHLPCPSTAVLAVLDPDHRLVASASFTPRPGSSDGWDHRNALLWHLRRIVPHDLRRRAPVRSGILLLCRDGDPGWTDDDGPWMWALRDACALHGLRRGAYITLTAQGWRVLGEGRGGRTPDSGSWAGHTAHGAALRPASAVPEALRRAAAR